jgi:hypothetical protein
MRQSKSSVIQRAWKCSKARQQLQGYRSERRQAEARWSSATLIQSIYRGFLVRETYLDVVEGVCKLQATYRGHLARRSYRVLKQTFKSMPSTGLLDETKLVISDSDPNSSLCIMEAPIKPIRNEELGMPRDLENSIASPDCEVDQVFKSECAPKWSSIGFLPKLHLKPRIESLNVDPLLMKSSPAKKLLQRQRRKTIAVTLSPMPYRTVIVQKSETANKDTTGEQERREQHVALRRKMLLRKQEERQKELDKLKKIAECEVVFIEENDALRL